MPVPPFIRPLLAYRGSTPNIADKTSKKIATHMFNSLGVTSTASKEGQELGVALEEGVKAHLITVLPTSWSIERRQLVFDFAQYRHLKAFDDIVTTYPTLLAELGQDYVIEPDVTVANGPRSNRRLHAAVSCKWTLRSDRAQNIRHEGVMLTRHRRGRQPHVVSVTPEPLPTRLAALARGTGELDGVYHVMFDELRSAVAAEGTEKQQRVLDELVRHRRLLPFDQLGRTLKH